MAVDKTADDNADDDDNNADEGIENREIPPCPGSILISQVALDHLHQAHNEQDEEAERIRVTSLER